MRLFTRIIHSNYIDNRLEGNQGKGMFIQMIKISYSIEKVIHRIRKQIVYNNLFTSQKGWILIDSVIGMVILSIAIIALVVTFTQATKGTTASANRIQATYLAQQTLEKLKAQDGNSTIDPTVISPVGKYTIVSEKLTVAAITTDPNQLSKYLVPYQVTVSWSDTSGGTSNNVQMVGYCYVNP